MVATTCDCCVTPVLIDDAGGESMLEKIIMMLNSSMMTKNDNLNKLLLSREWRWGRSASLIRDLTSVFILCLRGGNDDDDDGKDDGDLLMLTTMRNGREKKKCI